MAYFCLRWNGVLRCAFDARGDGVVAAPNEAVRSLILSTRYRTKLCYGQECDHKQSGLLQTRLGFCASYTELCRHVRLLLMHSRMMPSRADDVVRLLVSYSR